MGTVKAAELKYEEYTEEDAEKDAADLESGGGEFMTLKSGRNVIRILPAPVGSKLFLTVHQHYVNNKPYPCARLMAKKRCVICEKMDELKRSQSRSDQELGDSWYAKRRVFFNAIDRNDPEKGPQIVAVGKQVHEQIVALRRDEDAGGKFYDPINGFDFTILKSGTGKQTEYKVMPHKSSSQLAEETEQMQEWIDCQPQLGRYAALPNATDIAAALEDGEADEVEQPKRRTAPAARAQLPAASGRRPAPAATSTRRRTAEDDAIEVEAEDAE